MNYSMPIFKIIDVIRYPDITKNISTPTKPPGRIEGK